MKEYKLQRPCSFFSQILTICNHRCAPPFQYAVHDWLELLLEIHPEGRPLIQVVKVFGVEGVLGGGVPGAFLRGRCCDQRTCSRVVLKNWVPASG